MRTLYIDPSGEQKERSFFDSFLTLADDLPGGNWQRQESPDYVLEGINRTFGLELTTLVLPSPKGRPPLAAVRRSQEEVFGIARDLAISHSIPPLEVKVKFSSDHQPVDEQSAGIELFQFVIDQLPNINDKKSCHFHNIGSRYFSWIIIHLGTASGQQWLKEHRWGRIHAGFVRIDPIHEIQSVIDKKSRKISQYLKHCKECWLLIGVDEWTAPEAATLTEIGANTIYQFPFTRVYFLRNIERKLYRLTVS